MEIELRINAWAEEDVPPQVSPLDALREHLGLRGTRAGAVPARCSPTVSGSRRASRRRCSTRGARSRPSRGSTTYQLAGDTPRELERFAAAVGGHQTSTHHV